MDTNKPTTSRPEESIRVVHGQSQFRSGTTSSIEQHSQNGKVQQPSNGENNHQLEEAENDEMFHSFTPTSFDLLIPRLKLKVDQIHLKFNNIIPSRNSTHTKDSERNGLNGEHHNHGLLTVLSEWSDLLCSSLILTEREMSIYSAERDQSILIPYQLISLHGISRNPGETQASSIYCQLDDSLNNTHPDVQPQADQSSLENPEDLEPIELILTPNDSTAVEKIYEGLSFCASLHPTRPLMAANNDHHDSEHDKFDLDDHLISALLDNDDGNITSSTGKIQEQKQLDPSNRFNPY